MKSKNQFISSSFIFTSLLISSSVTQASISLVSDLRETAFNSRYQSDTGDIVSNRNVLHPAGPFVSWDSRLQNSLFSGRHVVGGGDIQELERVYIEEPEIRSAVVVNPDLPAAVLGAFTTFFEDQLGEPIGADGFTSDQLAQVTAWPDYQRMVDTVFSEYGVELIVEGSYEVGGVLAPDQVAALKLQSSGSLFSSFGNGELIDIAYETSTLGAVFAFTKSMAFNFDGVLDSSYGTNYSLTLSNLESEEVLVYQSVFTYGDVFSLEEIIVGPGTYEFALEIGGFAGGFDTVNYDVSAVFVEVSEVPLPPGFGLLLFSILGLFVSEANRRRRIQIG